MFLLLLFFFLFTPYCFSTSQVSVKAYIGQFQLSIYGFAIPYSKIELKSPNIYSLTYTNKHGLFQFKNILIPYNSSDICLYLTDPDHRPAPPVCLSSLYSERHNISLGPIIMPPTIGINRNILIGRSIPNTPTKISIFTSANNPPLSPKIANAYEIPTLTTISDEYGTFNLNVTTSYSTTYKVFAYSQHPELSNTPKSFILTYQVPSFFSLLIKDNYFFIIFFPIYISTIILFIYLIFTNSSKNNLYLAIYPKQLLIIHDQSK